MNETEICVITEAEKQDIPECFYDVIDEALRDNIALCMMLENKIYIVNLEILSYEILKFITFCSMKKAGLKLALAATTGCWAFDILSKEKQYKKYENDLDEYVERLEKIAIKITTSTLCISVNAFIKNEIVYHGMGNSINQKNDKLTNQELFIIFQKVYDCDFNSFVNDMLNSVSKNKTMH